MSKILRLKRQRTRGSAIVLALAFVGILGLAFLFFGLEYTKELGSYHEQRAAIDVASLAAAKALSHIVIEDPYFGFVGLSDYAPVGKTQPAPAGATPPIPAPNPHPPAMFLAPGTTAADGYPLPVQSINTILATVRIDMILADYMQDSIFQNLANSDYDYAMAAAANLEATLDSVIKSGNNSHGASVVDRNGNPVYDADGNPVNPYKDAVDAYKANKVRMSGNASWLVPDSLKLTLGYCKNIYTSRAPIPQPEIAGRMLPGQSAYGFYKPNIVINYQGQQMMFAALGADTTLVDGKTFSTDIGVALPDKVTAIPTVVKCEADQNYYSSSPQANMGTRTIHASSTALCGCILDQRPNPGKFTITFQNEVVPEIKCFGDLFRVDQIQVDPTDFVESPPDGDYPQTELKRTALPDRFYPVGHVGAHPRFSYMLSIAFYDWVRRAGPTMSIGNLIEALDLPFATMAGPQVHEYQIRSDGTVKYMHQHIPKVNLGVSQNQWRATTGLGLASLNGQLYDMQITDFVFQRGRKYGGKHGGEPLDDPGLIRANPSPFVQNRRTALFENPTWDYRAFLRGANDVPRPTYQKAGIAADITFRNRADTNQPDD